MVGEHFTFVIIRLQENVFASQKKKKMKVDIFTYAPQAKFFPDF